jgi:hypothetical protein
MSASLFAVTIKSYVEKRDLFAVKLRDIVTDKTVDVLISKENPLYTKLKKTYDTQFATIGNEISVNKLLFEGEIQTVIIGEAFL